MHARRLSALLAATVLSTLAAPVAADAAPTAPAAPPSVAPANGRADGDPRTGHRSTGRLQVRFKDGVTAKGRDAALARVRAKGRAADVVRTAPGLNAALLRVDDARAVQALLREDPAVAYAEAESSYRPLAITPDTQTAERSAANLPTATTRGNETAPTGAGTEIAVIDSIVDTANPDLAGKVVHTQDLTEPVGDGDPNDGWLVTDLACNAERCPHGTGVAAVAVGADGNGFVVGAAPEATVSSYNVFRRFLYQNQTTGDTFEDLSASSLDIAEALDAVRQRAVANPALVAVNLSLGGTFDNQLVKDELAQLRADAPHVTVVVAAGNDGGERAQFPAGDPGVISVGSTGTESETCPSFSGPTTVSSFSNRGDVDVVAPGACVLTWYRPTGTIPGQHAGARLLTRVNGTSFSAPMVAGVVALLGEQGVTGDAARAAIVAAAAKPAIANVAAGAGFLDAASALALATGTTAYTAAFVDRGGQVANQVGRRTVEVLEVQPGGTAPAEPTAPTLTAGRGTLSDPQSAAQNAVRRTTYAYTPPAANVGPASFTLTAGSVVVPMRLLDPTDNFEGLPVPSGDQSSVLLTYGSRSAYVRSAPVAGGHPLRLDYTYGDGGQEYADPDVPPSSDLFVWEPISAGATADAAMEPFTAAMGSQYTGTKNVHSPRSGRYLFGWVLFSEEDDSNPADATSRYRLKPTYGPIVSTFTAPALASTESGSGPFRVSWTGSYGVRYEIDWMTKVKRSDGVWVDGTWRRWTTTTGPAGFAFGQNSKPTAIVKGQTYWFRLRSFDVLNNPSPMYYRATVAPQDNLSTSFSYAGSWSKRALGGRWFGWVHQSGTRGASVTHRAETSQFTVVGDRCTTCGQFQVWVDGALKATVDTRASSGQYRQVLWTSPNYGAPRPHTIKLVVLGTSRRPWVVLDGIGTRR